MNRRHHCHRFCCKFLEWKELLFLKLRDSEIGSNHQQHVEFVCVQVLRTEPGFNVHYFLKRLYSTSVLFHSCQEPQVWWGFCEFDANGSSQIGFNSSMIAPQTRMSWWVSWSWTQPAVSNQSLLQHTLSWRYQTDKAQKDPKARFCATWYKAWSISGNSGPRFSTMSK
jgi:hypothetical protein